MRVFDSRWKGTHGIGRFAAELHARLPEFQSIAISGRPSSPRDPWILRSYLLRTAPELFLSPGYNAPAGSPCAFVFCIHDLNHLFVRENSGALKRAYYEYVIRPAARRARRVLTVSEYSRRAICEWVGIAEQNVVNVGNGVSAAFKPEGKGSRTTAPYFLHVGNHRPHKNFARVLQAFALSDLAGDFALVSTGTPSEDLLAEIGRLGLSRRVVFVGNVSDDQLAGLYRAATALVLVSLYEGFGLPIIEAMSCGTPVLTSDAAAMPEVAGDAAMLVDPYDVEAIAEAMKKLASDTSLRASLRMRGLQHARQYSWDAVAERVRHALCGI